MGVLRPLHEIIPGWDASAPTSGDELLQADPEHLDALARELRRHMVLAAGAFQTVSFLTPAEVGERIAKGHLVPKVYPKPKWDVIALDAKRNRVVRPANDGSVRTSRWTSRRVPDAEQLESRVPLPEGGTYLVVYYGPPDILSVGDGKSTVADDLAQLASSVPICDVVFWQDDPDGAYLWSGAAGTGRRMGGDRATIDFPGRHLLQPIFPAKEGR